MILYFSSTGNCKYTAERIAARTAERVVSLGAEYKSGNFDILPDKGEPLGFVLPTYFGCLPSIVTDYLERAKIRLDDSNYVYTVDTYGFHYGNVAAELAKLLREKAGREQDADFLLQSVDNWVPNFDLTDSEYVQSALKKADELLEQVIADIVERKRVRIRGEWPAPMHLMMKKAYKGASRTKNFTVSDKCVGCGKCAEQCPLDVITLKDGLPVWLKKRCTLCLGCLHVCPENAIAYTKATVGHGQYYNPKTTR